MCKGVKNSIPIITISPEEAKKILGRQQLSETMKK